MVLTTWVACIIRAMNSLSNHRDLFRPSTVTEKLKLFHVLFDSSEINLDIALALLKVIHSDLVNERTRDRSDYKKYAGTIAKLRYHKADMLRQIVAAWKPGDVTTVKDPEWLSDGRIK